MPTPLLAETKMRSSAGSPNTFSISMATRSGRLREGQFVDDRNEFKVLFDGEIGVGHGLGLNSLGGVNQQRAPRGVPGTLRR